MARTTGPTDRFQYAVLGYSAPLPVDVFADAAREPLSLSFEDRAKWNAITSGAGTFFAGIDIVEANGGDGIGILAAEREKGDSLESTLALIAAANPEDGGDDRSTFQRITDAVYDIGTAWNAANLPSLSHLFPHITGNPITYTPTATGFNTPANPTTAERLNTTLSFAQNPDSVDPNAPASTLS